jgi:hypothetical protein
LLFVVFEVEEKEDEWVDVKYIVDDDIKGDPFVI